MDYIYLSLIFLSILCGFLFVKKESHIAFKLLLFFLVITFFNELFCFYLKSKLISTYFYYNLYAYFRFPFLGYIFLSLFKKYKVVYKWMIVFFYSLSIFIFLYCYQKYGGLQFFHTTYFVIGCSFIILSGIFYLFNLYQSDDDVNIFDNVFFLSTIALMFYFIGVMPFVGVFNVLVKKSSNLAFYQSTISKSLSIVFYLILSLDFYVQWKNLKLKY